MSDGLNGSLFITVELKDFNEQLQEILAEIQNIVNKDIPKAQAKAKSEKCEYAKNRLNRSKQLLKSYNVELRELSRADAKPWEEKAREYEAQINKLAEEITWASTSADRDELFNNKGRNADEMTAKDLVDQAKVVQEESKASTSRAKQVLDQTIAVGSETTDALKKQTDQLNNVDQNLDVLESNLKRADKQIRIFLRRMATDKVIMVMVFLVIIGIITAIIVSIVKKKVKGETINGPGDIFDSGRSLDTL